MKYLIAAGLVLLSSVLAFAIHPLIGPMVDIFFTVAVLVSSLRFGLGPGLLAAAASVLVSSYSFIDPPDSFGVSNKTDVAVLFILVVIAFVAARERHSKQEISHALAARSNELDAVKTLVSPHLPICNQCGKFQTEQGDWITLTDYVHQNFLDPHFSFCPQCAAALQVQAQEDCSERSVG